MSLSLKDAAKRVLHEAGEPLHYQEITTRILQRKLSQSKSKTPAASVNAVLSVEIKRHGNASPFVRVTPGVFGLRSDASLSTSVEKSLDVGSRRVRIPHFPRYAEVRLLLPVWTGVRRTEVTSLHSTIGTLRGTPQEPVDWSSPDEWIPDRLVGGDRDIALAMWDGTGHRVNPRHVYGHWLLVTKYELLVEDLGGVLILSERGADFLESPGGKTEVLLDESEGLLKILALVADIGPAGFGNLVEAWGEYLSRRSTFGTDSTIKDTLRRRLPNLLERGFLLRSGTQYTISEAGLAYLGQAGDEDASVGDEHQEIRKLVRQQEASARETIRDILAALDPFGFEHLVKRLLEEMGYDEVEVTSPSGDGGCGRCRQHRTWDLIGARGCPGEAPQTAYPTQRPRCASRLPSPLRCRARHNHHDLEILEGHKRSSLRAWRRPDYPYRWRQAHRPSYHPRDRSPEEDPRDFGARRGGVCRGRGVCWREQRRRRMSSDSMGEHSPFHL